MKSVFATTAKCTLILNSMGYNDECTTWPFQILMLLFKIKFWNSPEFTFAFCYYLALIPCWLSVFCIRQLSCLNSIFMFCLLHSVIILARFHIGFLSFAFCNYLASIPCLFSGFCIRSQAYVLAKPDLGQNLLHILVVTCFWYCSRWRHPVLTWIGILHYLRIQGQYSAKYASNDYGHELYKVSNDRGSYGKWLFKWLFKYIQMESSWIITWQVDYRKLVSLILVDDGMMRGAGEDWSSVALGPTGLPCTRVAQHWPAAGQPHPCGEVCIAREATWRFRLRNVLKKNYKKGSAKSGTQNHAKIHCGSSAMLPPPSRKLLTDSQGSKQPTSSSQSMPQLSC